LKAADSRFRRTIQLGDDIRDQLILERGDLYSTSRVDYHGGARYPHLEHIDGKADLLSVLGKPLKK